MARPLYTVRRTDTSEVCVCGWCSRNVKHPVWADGQPEHMTRRKAEATLAVCAREGIPAVMERVGGAEAGEGEGR